MKLQIDKGILEKFPDLCIGIVTAKEIDNQGSSQDVLNKIKEREKEIRKNFNTEELAQHPKLDAWRKAYSAFGAKPKKYKCSVENLYRMILGGIELKHINKIVDIYNLISIKHIIPVGGDDIDKVDGSITLKLADGSEPFIQLNSAEASHPKPGEVVYVDDKEVLCRRWNWRECDKSKMTSETKNVALVVEGLPPVTQEEVQKILDELSALVKKVCGGVVKTHVLDSSHSEADL